MSEFDEAEWRAIIKLVLAGKIDSLWAEEVLLTEAENDSLTLEAFDEAIRPLREAYTEERNFLVVSGGAVR